MTAVYTKSLVKLCNGKRSTKASGTKGRIKLSGLQTHDMNMKFKWLKQVEHFGEDIDENV